MSELSREDFLIHIEYIRRDLDEVKQHLANLNGRTRETERAIAVNEKAIADISDRSDTNRRSGIWTALAAAAVGIVESLHWWRAH